MLFTFLLIHSLLENYMQYASETIKLLLHKPDDILLAAIFEQITRLGMIYPVFEPVSTT